MNIRLACFYLSMLIEPAEIVSALKVKFYDIPPRKTSVKTMSISLTGSQKESDV